MDIKLINLDDLVPESELAKLKAKRKAKGTHDLSDLIGERKPRPPEIEILEAVQVIFMAQENTCLNCKRVVRWPLGLVAMHKLKRHGRQVSDLAGVALSEGNQHPHLPRVHQITASTSIVCAECVDEARFIPKPEHPLPIPSPGDPLWFEQHRCAVQSEVHQVLENKKHLQDIIKRELAEGGEEKLPMVEPPLILGSGFFDDPPEYTDPEDTR